MKTQANRCELDFWYTASMVVAFCVVGGGLVRAADVQLSVSTDEAYVGLPFILQVHIDNAKDHDPPSIPDVDGLLIQSSGPPSQSTMTSRVQDNRGTRTTTRSSFVYRFSMTPQREGEFTIPPIKVVADGVATVTKSVKFEASKSETGDLLFVEVDSTQKEVYVGEPLELSLEIWIRPYEDQEREIKLSEGAMWSQIQPQTNWGPFADRMQELNENRRRPGGDEAMREDGEGKEREYYRYTIDAKIYPKRSGSIDGQDVRVIMHYPLRLDESRNTFDDFFDDSSMSRFFPRPFGSRIRIGSVRPIVATAASDLVNVKPIPQQGRPSTYRGAVGTYKIITQATPTATQVGDPIQFLIAIDGTGPMDLVRAPSLADNPRLSANFKVSDDPLAGFVDGERKVFSTNIVPKNDSVTEIPPIQYSFFDPEKEEFVTVQSKPIPITVEKSEMLALDSIVANRPETDPPGQNDDAAPVASSRIVANFYDDRVLQPQVMAKPWSLAWLLLIAVPPLVVLSIRVAASRHRIEGLLNYLVPADRRLRSRVAAAETPEGIAAAVQEYVARSIKSSDRKASDLSSARRLVDIGRLRASGKLDAAVRVERIYATSEKLAIEMPGSSQRLDQLKLDVLELIDAMNVKKPKNSRQSYSAAGRTTGRASTWFGCIVLATSHCAFAQTRSSDGGVTLSSEQVSVLLREANQAYRLADQQSDASAALQLFGDAAEKYELIMDAGVQNGRLAFNAGNACMYSEQYGRAVAYFRRALRYEPENHLFRTQLITAEHRLGFSENSIKTSWGENASEINHECLGFLSLSGVLAIFASAWIGLWIVVAFGAVGKFASWKSAVAFLLPIVCLSAWSYATERMDATDDSRCVILADRVALRESDDATMPIIATIENAEGRSVQRLNRRGDWYKVQADAAEGWVPAEHLCDT